MHALLIQPPAAPHPVAPRRVLPGSADRFAPAWDLLSIGTFLKERTRHSGHFVDARFYGNLEKGLSQSVSAYPSLRLALIYTTSLTIGQVAPVADILKRINPRLPIAICGPHPSRFPDRALLPHVDYALCGDPEPILRNLLDHLDAPQRLKRIPGLIMANSDTRPAAWLQDLNTLVAPDYEGISWPGYRLPPPRQGALMEVALSRGHTRQAFDRAFGGTTEPHRIWPFDRIAASLQRARHAGIVEAFITDPPGFWLGGRLTSWLDHLDRAHNTLPWSLQLIPQVLTAATIDQLRLTKCRRIEFLFPTAESDRMTAYELRVKPRDMVPTMELLAAAGIEVENRIWVAGPESTDHEPAAVYRLIHDLRYAPYGLCPYPLDFDSPVYAAQPPDQRPALDDWMVWAQDPWLGQRPVACWGAEAGIDQANKTMDRIEEAVARSPKRRWVKLVDRLRSVRVIESLENAALGAMPRRPAGPPPR